MQSQSAGSSFPFTLILLTEKLVQWTVYIYTMLISIKAIHDNKWHWRIRTQSILHHWLKDIKNDASWLLLVLKPWVWWSDPLGCAFSRTLCVTGSMMEAQWHSGLSSKRTTASRSPSPGSRRFDFSLHKMHWVKDNGLLFFSPLSSFKHPAFGNDWIKRYLYAKVPTEDGEHG